MTRTLAGFALAALAALSLDAGARAFEAGRYDEAAAAYASVLARGEDSPLLRYNLGTVLLHAGRHEEAREHLARAAAEDVGPALRQPAHYNAGNLDLEPAHRAPPSPERDDALRRAILAYRRALLLDPADLDAKWNLELARRLLTDSAGGGGGGGGDGGAGGGGAAGDDREDPARPDPDPAPGAAGEGAGMSQAEAERVLRAAVERERPLQQEKLRRTQRPPPNVRDW